MRVLAVIAILVAGCRIEDTFSCDTDGQCRLGDGTTGTCAAHYCASADAACKSGQRYDVTAPGEMSGACVACTETPWYVDADGDGHGDATKPVTMACLQPPGLVATADDCDDADKLRHPGAADVCDGVDNDCDALTTDVCAPGCSVHHRPVPNDAHIYMFCTQQVVFANAQQICTTNDDRLLRVDDSNENNFVISVSPVDVWTGGTDSAIEGTWMWEDGEVFFQNNAAVGGLYNNWKPGQPDDNGNQDCIDLTSQGWDDEACTNQHGIVCERY